MTEEELAIETDLKRLSRKRDQAWEMAGCARQDNDTADEKRWTDAARRISHRIKQLLSEPQ